VFVMIVRVCGMSMAAPSPWMARNPISQPGLGARPRGRVRSYPGARVPGYVLRFQVKLAEDRRA